MRGQVECRMGGELNDTRPDKTTRTHGRRQKSRGRGEQGMSERTPSVGGDARGQVEYTITIVQEGKCSARGHETFKRGRKRTTGQEGTQEGIMLMD